jgi:polysaccharide export outer membrane protein
VVVHSVLEKIPAQYVTITGEVNRAGQYPYASSMTVKDIIFAGGNFKESAYLDEGELASQNIEKGKSFAVSYRKIDIGKAMAGDPAHNVPLKPFDRLFVKRIPDWKEERYVEIRGEVYYPGRYMVRKGEKLDSLVERAGGYTQRAFLKGSIFSRESVRALQQKTLEEAVERMEKSVLSQSASVTETSFNTDEAKQAQYALAQKRALLAKMKSAKARGRMVIKLDALEKFRSSAYNIELEDGDVLNVPEKPNSIQVIGSVYSASAFVFDPRGTISSYMAKAGGVTTDADENEMFILKVDGSAVSRRQGGMFFSSTRLDPGDTIVVPEDLERIAWLREIKDISQIVYQFAVATGVLIIALH